MGNRGFDLSGQRVLISGAAGGLGSATARACAQMGAELILADLTPPNTLADELRSSSKVTIRTVALDTTDRDAVAALVEEIGEIDALADLSGIYRPGDWINGGDEWEALLSQTLDVNLRGPLNLVRAVMPLMSARGQGRIALTTSLAGRSAGTTAATEPAYVASKGALQALVRSFARQAAPHGVVVNAVAPGPIMTAMTAGSSLPFKLDVLPTGRFGDPAEIGWPMAFLCSEACTYMTGVVLDVNGGLHFS